VGFTPRTRDAARDALDDPEVLGLSRSCAFFALGSIQSVAARPLLQLEAREAPGIERRGAVLGLGEMGASLKEGVELLLELLSDPDPVIVNDALLALARCGSPRAQARLVELAAAVEHPLRQGAIAALTFVRLPRQPSQFESVTLLLNLRFESAKRYGSLNGKPWSQHRMDELKQDDEFLDELILMAAANLRQPGIKDHLLELAIQAGRPVRWRAAAYALPAEVERMILSGLGGPRRPQEWTELIDGAVESGWAGQMPETFGMALSIRSLAPTAAAQLLRGDPDLEQILRAAFRGQKREPRIRAAEAVGRLGLEGYLVALRGLSEPAFAPDSRGPNRMRLSAAAWVARLRLGDLSANEYLLEVLVGRNPMYNDDDRAVVLDALEKACLAEVVVQFLDGVSSQAEGSVQAEIQALLALSGRASPGADLRTAYNEAQLGSSSARRLLRGMAHLPRAEDLEFLAGVFPLEGSFESNVLLARVLVENGHEKIEPILQAAVWRGPWHRSVLAAAVVAEHRGVDLLMHWVANPPATASSLDMRRLGFSIGEWGGLAVIDDLRDLLGSAAGAERPALQGALLGALTTRTH